MTVETSSPPQENGTGKLAKVFSVPTDDCPDCGRPKVKKAKRCKACAHVAQRGVPRTDTPAEMTSRARARLLCPPGPCTYDGCSEDGRDVHHIDGDHFNNTPSNLTRMCRRHHMTVDGRLEKARERAARVGRECGGFTKAKREGKAA